MPRMSCTIVVNGELSDHFAGAFDGLSLVRTPGVTKLRGEVADQSALQGVLRQVTNLGLEIVSVWTHSIGEDGPTRGQDG